MAELGSSWGESDAGQLSYLVQISVGFEGFEPMSTAVEGRSILNNKHLMRKVAAYFL